MGKSPRDLRQGASKNCPIQRETVVLPHEGGGPNLCSIVNSIRERHSTTSCEAVQGIGYTTDYWENLKRLCKQTKRMSFCVFCAFRERGCAPVHKKRSCRKKRRVQRRRELIADEGRLQDGDRIFSNILSYTRLPTSGMGVTAQRSPVYHNEERLNRRFRLKPEISTSRRKSEQSP